MSSFHHKAELIKIENSLICYKFHPSILDHKSYSGEFIIDLDKGEVFIHKPSGINELFNKNYDEICMNSLAAKFYKNYKEDDIPETICFMA